MLIKYTYEKRFLGIHLAEDVKWDVHVNHVCDTLNKSFYIIHSLKKVIGINVLRGIYFANFHSHLRYGITFWGGDSQGLKVFKMQKRVVRLMGNVQKRMSYRELFKKLRILPMPCLYIMEMIIYIKTNNGGLK